MSGYSNDNILPPSLGEDGFCLQCGSGPALALPVHEHPEYELSLLLHARGVRRIVGNHIGTAGDIELVLTGPDLPHGWLLPVEEGAVISYISVKWQADLLPEQLLGKNQLSRIRLLLADAQRGIQFQGSGVDQLAGHLLSLREKEGFDGLHGLLSLIDALSKWEGCRLLSDITFTQGTYRYNSRRLENVFQYMYQNFGDQITLEMAAGIANMPPASFSRFIKVHTGRTFTENLAEIRMGHVTRMLVATADPIADIAYSCGFNNLANFNRIFKSWTGLTPREFKKSYIGGWSYLCGHDESVPEKEDQPTDRERPPLDICQ